MRWISGLTSTALLAFAAAPALAQTAPADLGAVDGLFSAAFARPAPPGLGLSLSSSVSRTANSITLTEDRFVPGQGLARWTVKEVSLPSEDGAADTLRLSTAGLDPRGLVGLQIRPGMTLDPSRTEDIDVAYIRGWPSALKVRTGGGYALAVSPHAGLGVSNRYGGSAEAGATVSFGNNVEDKVKGALGVADGRKRFGDQQRWYVFAAASGKAVGLNLVDNGSGLQRSGLSLDQGGFVGEAQAGVGWRKGTMQASFGYVHEKLKSHLFGVRSESDDRLALTLAWHAQ